MTRAKVLIDSSFLFVLFHLTDGNHKKVLASFLDNSMEFFIPQIVLAETAWLFNRAGGMRLVSRFLTLLSEVQIPLEDVTYVDLRRASELLTQYPGTKLEFVDCCIVALAERLKIERVATLDRRDFSVLRTNEGKFLEIVP